MAELGGRARKRHWKTEIVASTVEMLSGRRKKDYEAEHAATDGETVAAPEAADAASEPVAMGA